MNVYVLTSNLRKKETLDNMLASYLNINSNIKPFHKFAKNDRKNVLEWYYEQYNEIGYNYKKQEWFIFETEAPHNKCTSYENL